MKKKELIPKKKVVNIKKARKAEKTAEEKEKASKRGRASKNKGANYERAMAKLIGEKLGVELKRTPQSGGFASGKVADDFRGDILTVDPKIDFKLHLECKNQKRWSLPAWIRQAEDDCPEDRVMAVVIHRGREVKDGKEVEKAGDFITMEINDFFDIVDKDKIVVKKA